jgi:Patched family
MSFCLSVNDLIHPSSPIQFQILIDFFYQVTFFISLIVLDEQRIAANRLDVCFWATRPTPDALAVGDTFEETESPTNTRVSASSDSLGSEDGRPVQNTAVKQRRVSRKIQPIEEKAHVADRFMYWFANKLLLPKVQVFVVALFLFVLMGSISAATRLRQKFNYVDMVPSDSYMKDYFEAMDEYTHRTGIYTYVFFRDVDQSDPIIQDEMMNYVEDLTTSGAIAHYPVYFWLKDFKEYVQDFKDILGELTFEEQILEFFKVPGFEDLYGEHVAYNETTGEVWESRCVAYVDVDLQDTKDGSEMLNSIRHVDARQPINNDGRERWAFLTYADDYHMIE